MRILCFYDIVALQPYAAAWNRLAAGIPFRSWEWLSTWWRHYGPQASAGDRKRTLCVLGVFDELGALVGLAPCYATESAMAGRVLRLLGDGEVCSEYVTVLAAPGYEETTGLALAEYLAGRFGAARSSPDRWDQMILEAVDTADPVLHSLLGQLGQLGATIHCRPGPGCWRIELPDAWGKMYESLSKNQRKQVRRVLRRAENHDTLLHKVECCSELSRAFHHLVDLHQRRWEGRGRPGCFASDRFLAFHHDVMPQLLRAGQLQMVWLEAEGKPLAAEYQVSGAGVTYLYQAGIDPDRLAWDPGHLITARSLQLAMDQGCRRFDFLRGDEPYKAQWQARFHGNRSVRVVARRPGARMRHQAWLAARHAKDWARRGLEMAGVREARPYSEPPPAADE